MIWRLFKQWKQLLFIFIKQLNSKNYVNNDKKRIVIPKFNIIIMLACLKLRIIFLFINNAKLLLKTEIETEIESWFVIVPSEEYFID